jgi:integrator complex subunit 7
LLRALGTLAVIIPERKQVHHSIRNALDSHDSVELQAAIYTAGRFAARSKTFAVNMCSKISEMISGLETPLDRKLKLIPIFQHMYHDAQTAQVRTHLRKI